jgi:hypothetical protein
MRVAFVALFALIGVELSHGLPVSAQDIASTWDGMTPSLLPQVSGPSQLASSNRVDMPTAATSEPAPVPLPMSSSWDSQRHEPQGTGVSSGSPKIQGLPSTSPVPPAALPLAESTIDKSQRYPLPERVPQLNAPALPIGNPVAFPGETEFHVPSPRSTPLNLPSVSDLPLLESKSDDNRSESPVENAISAETYLENSPASDEHADLQNEAKEIGSYDTYFDKFDISRQTCTQSRWFGGTYGLVMMRDYESGVKLSYDPFSLNGDTLSSDDANYDVMGGVEATFGRQNKNGLGWQVTYWGLYPGQQSKTMGPSPDTLMPWLSNVTYAANGFGSDSGLNWFNAGLTHTVSRENEIHNIELNFLSFLPLCSTTSNACSNDCSDLCEPRYKVSLFGGVRYFTFKEYFGYRSAFNGISDLDSRDLNFDLNVDNHLIGLQGGGDFNFCLRRKLTLTGGTKVGAFANYIEHQQGVYGSYGFATINTGFSAGADCRYESEKTAFAMLGEIRLGLAYQLTEHWRATGGYRAMGISGVALAPNQIFANDWLQPGEGAIHSNGALILHGAYFGVEFAY